MSDEQIRNPQMPNNGTSDPGAYEHEDLSARGVIYFMVGLAVVVVVIYFIVFGMYHFLDTYENAHQPAMSPMVTPQTDTRNVTPEDTQAFPQPRLEVNERNQLRTFVEDEERTLATYNWVDKDKGIVHIPIERAMDLIVERGLPIRPENARPEKAGLKNSGPEGSTAAQIVVPENMKKQTPQAPAGKAAARGN